MLTKYLASCLFKKRNRQEKKHRERGDESRRWRVWETSRPDKHPGGCGQGARCAVGRRYLQTH